MWLSLLRQRQEVLSVAAAQVVGLAGCLEPLERELADRLEHPVPLAGVADEVLVDQRFERVNVRIGDSLTRRERAAAGEDGEAGEECLLRVRQQVVRPLDGRAQGLLARVGVTATLEQV